MVLLPHCRFCHVVAHIDVSWSRQDSGQSVSMYQCVCDYCLHILPFLLELVTACICLTLKAPNKNCSRRHFNFLLLSFEEIRPDFSCESSAKQRIHLKHQVLFSLKNNEKIFMNVVCCSLLLVKFCHSLQIVL